MKKLLSIMLICSLVIMGTSCDKLPIKVTGTTTTEKTVETTKDDTYYSVTNAYTAHDKNFYMELDVKIPKIEYSNEESDTLIDPINEEILNTITELVENAKSNAMDTYEVYLSSAAENIKLERDKRIKDLKSKYKNIIGRDEVKAIAEVLNTEIKTEPDFKNNFGTVRRGAPFFNKFASKSDADKVFVNDKPLDGFTNTEVVIDPNLHNKNIIIKSETTTAIDDENKNIPETFKIEGRPGKTVDEFPIPKGADKKFDGSFDPKKFEKKETVKETEVEETNIEELPDVVIVEKEVDIIIADVEKEEQVETLTLDDFYRELEEIKHMTIPNRNSLTREYVPTYIHCDFDVECLDEDYLSLYISLSESRITEKVKTFFYNIDLKNKKTIGIKDMLGDNYKETCINTINAAIDKWDDDKKSALNKDYDITKFINDDTKFFINNNHMPVVVFDKYSIASSAILPIFVIAKK